MNRPQLSIIIPAYNEETNIRLGALEKVSKYFSTYKNSWQVLIVNDGSSDATSELLSEFCSSNRGFSVINNPHRGKAATVIAGMKAAKGELLLFSDLDQATPIKELEKLLPWVSKGYDIVIGSRNTRREGAPLFRRIMARGFMMLRSFILGLHGIQDTQCGFKLFTQKSAINIIKRLKLYQENANVSGSMVTAGFDIELLYLAKQLGYTIKEVGVEWHYVETRRVSPLKDSWQGLVDILRIRINAIIGKYSYSSV